MKHLIFQNGATILLRRSKLYKASFMVFVVSGLLNYIGIAEGAQCDSWTNHTNQGLIASHGTKCDWIHDNTTWSYEYEVQNTHDSLGRLESQVTTSSTNEGLFESRVVTTKEYEYFDDSSDIKAVILGINHSDGSSKIINTSHQKISYNALGEEVSRSTDTKAWDSNQNLVLREFKKEFTFGGRLSISEYSIYSEYNAKGRLNSRVAATTNLDSSSVSHLNYSYHEDGNQTKSLSKTTINRNLNNNKVVFRSDETILYKETGDVYWDMVDSKYYDSKDRVSAKEVVLTQDNNIRTHSQMSYVYYGNTNRVNKLIYSRDVKDVKTGLDKTKWISEVTYNRNGSIASKKVDEDSFGEKGRLENKTTVLKQGENDNISTTSYNYLGEKVIREDVVTNKRKVNKFNQVIQNIEIREVFEKNLLISKSASIQRIQNSQANIFVKYMIENSKIVYTSVFNSQGEPIRELGGRGEISPEEILQSYFKKDLKVGKKSIQETVKTQNMILLDQRITAIKLQRRKPGDDRFIRKPATSNNALVSSK